MRNSICRYYILIGCYYAVLEMGLALSGPTVKCRLNNANQNDAGKETRDDGAVLKNRIEEIIREDGVEKLNVIAHAKGGLDIRYAISTLGIGERIASVTTINTPHHGSLTVDALLKVPDVLIRFGSWCMDIWMRILGDKQPDTYSAIQSFRTTEAERFNEENPDVEGIYYQSYGFVMRHAFSDIFLCWTYPVVYYFEGENDGLLAPRATRWTNFKGIYRGNSGRGISHCDEIDMRRRPLTRKTGPDEKTEGTYKP